MWFLILEILLLMILAALLGAALTYWWMRGRYEDVTESFTALSGRTRSDGVSIPVNALSRDDLKQELQSFKASLSSPDKSDLDSILAEIERVRLDTPVIEGPSQVNLMPVVERMDRLETVMTKFSSSPNITAPGSSFNPQPLYDHIQTLTHKIDAMSQAPALTPEFIQDYQNRFQHLNQLHEHTRTELATQVQAISTPDTGLTESFINEYKTRMSELIVAFNGLHERMDGVSQSNSDDVLIDGLSTLEGRLATIEQVVTRDDTASELNGVKQRLEIMERTSKTDDLLVTLSSVDGRLSQIEQASLQDATPSAISAVESRLGSLEHSLSPADLVASMRAIQDRLILIEQTTSSTDVLNGLNAVMERVNGLESLMSSLDTTVDLGPLTQRVDEARNMMMSLRPELQGLNALSSMNNTLDDLKKTIFDMRDIDMSSVVKSVRSVDSRIDLTSIENRLTAIEYGLAATLHQTRSRLVEADRIPAPQREPFRSGNNGRSNQFDADKMLDRGRPADALDPLDIIRHPDRVADRLLEPGFGRSDDLEQIHGVGPVLHKLLNDLGIYYFWQIAGWSERDVVFMDNELDDYRGEIIRGNWQLQAKALSESPNAAQRPSSVSDD